MAKWMGKAFGAHTGRLHRALGVAEDEPIPGYKLQEARHSDDPHMRRMASLARTGKRFAGGAKKHLVPRGNR